MSNPFWWTSMSERIRSRGLVRPRRRRVAAAAQPGRTTTLARAAVILVVAAAAACSAARSAAPPPETIPPEAIAPESIPAGQATLVETLPTPESAFARSPFDMAAPDMAAARRLVGCYAVTLGPWSSPQAHGGRIPAPTRVDLRSDFHTRVYIGFRLVALTPGFADRTERVPPAWGPVGGGDSLQLRAWGDGTSSLFFFLRRQTAGELRGTARYFTDGRVEDGTGRWMWETYPSASVSLRPTQCDAGSD